MGEDPAAAGRREPDDEPAGREAVEPRAEDLEIGNRVHPAGTAAEIPLALLAPQKELGEDREILLLDATEPLIAVVAIAGDAAAAVDLGHDTGGAERLEGPSDLILVDGHERVAVALLVAAGDDRVEGEGIGLRRRLPLLDEDAEHPPLDRVERANPRTWALRFGIHQRISSFPGRDAGDGEQAPRHRPDIKTATPVTFPATALHRSDAGSRRG